MNGPRFKLLDRVRVDDKFTGTVVARAFDQPARYDIQLSRAGRVMMNVTEDRVTPMRKQVRK